MLEVTWIVLQSCTVMVSELFVSVVFTLELLSKDCIFALC